ncbi:MAG TPA: XRE family transcriptional regulator [Beijerinckiaceae bacterium]|jgi:Zn-dependent peptidase ImmA (M78 family)/transcriptional regulator with XRE-family HTH domain
MSVGVQTFRGERLKEARLARGLFKKSLADMVGITGTAITRYEEGQDKPQHDRLVALAAHLNFPFEFFLRPEWPERLETVLWRSRAAETKHAREMTEQRMRWLCEVFHFLEQEVNFPNYALPELDLPSDFRLISPERIELAALELRRAWGLRESPIPDVILALENAGLPVVTLEISSDKQDGFFFTSASLARSFVGINVYNVSAARARFDAGHELGHAVLHRHVTAQQSRDPGLHKIMEQQAHRFAGAFLFPKDAFLREVGAVSLDYFSALKKRWGMSIAAMIFRAFDLGLIDEFEKATLQQNMGRRRWRGPLREPFDSPSEMPLERPRMLRRGVETVLKENTFGRPALRAALALPSRELEQLAGLDDGFFNAADPVPFEVSLKRDRGLRAIDLESGNVLEFPRRRQQQ